MTISAENIKAFVIDAKKARENWLSISQRSWNEIKKRQSNGKVWLAPTGSTKRMRGKYPAWYSVFKIRQPITLSRVGIPIGKDTSQDAKDAIGQTAAVLIERLAVNLAKDFDFFDVMLSCRDDALATNLATCRAYYESEEVKEKVKIRLQAVQNPETGESLFVDETGKEILSDDIGQDDEGFFIETDEVVGVKNEKICLEPVIYDTLLVDPDIARFKKCKRLCFILKYSPEEFKEIFGINAYIDLAQSAQGQDEEKKQGKITVYEYWDYYSKTTSWVAEEGSELLTPLRYPEDQSDGRNGLYDLKNFFPIPSPIAINQATDEFWPVPEYLQVQEVLEDIHMIFNRLMQLTRGVRVRLMYDSNVEGLGAVLNEASELDTFAVPNLAQALSGAGGTLNNVVQYLDVSALIQGLQDAYTALENRLNILYKLTGTSDLLQGLITDPTQRTLGERQMTEKYALNQIAEMQRKIAEFVRDSYELLVEMALNNFEERTLEKYIVPATLTEEQRQAYPAALELLKTDKERFRIELETDSTIALNEEYDKQIRIELANVLTQALEKTASIAQTNPELVQIELHVLKYLIQGFRQGKLFQNEITQAIDAAMQAAQQPQQPAFNKDEADSQFKAQELQLKQQELQLKQQETQVNIQLEYDKLQQTDRLAALENQLKQLQTQIEASKDSASQQLDFQKLQIDSSLAQQDLALKQQALEIDAASIGTNAQLDQYKMQLEERVAASEIALAQSKQQLEEYLGQLSLQERIATEKRLQSEHEMSQLETEVNLAAKVKEANTQEAIKAPRFKKQIKIEANELGGIKKFEEINEQGE